MSDSNLEVELIGEAARDGLISGQRVEVLASVSQALYLLTKENELYWITGESSPMHRRGLRVSSAVPRLAVGTLGEVQDHALTLGTGNRLVFSNSPVWSAPALKPGNGPVMARLPGRIATILRFIADWPKPSGFGSLIPAILLVLSGQDVNQKDNMSNILVDTAWQAVNGMIQAGLKRNSQLILENARDLVGFGEGLTPSGDDFLGGFFFSIHCLLEAYPDSLDMTGWNYSDFLVNCQPRTNPISFNLLKDHAEGYAMDPLHRLAQALSVGETIDQLLPHAEELVGVGHSTGWDILTGFLAGMSVLCANPETTF